MQLNQDEVQILLAALSMSRTRLMENPKYGKRKVWDVYSKLWDYACKGVKKE